MKQDSLDPSAAQTVASAAETELLKTAMIVTQPECASASLALSMTNAAILVIAAKITLLVTVKSVMQMANVPVKMASLGTSVVTRVTAVRWELKVAQTRVTPLETVALATMASSETSAVTLARVALRGLWMDSMFAMRTRCVNVELAIPEMAVVTISAIAVNLTLLVRPTTVTLRLVTASVTVYSEITSAATSVIAVTWME